MAEQLPVVVIDTGSGVTKAGFSGEDSPRAVFPSVIGRPRKTLTGVSADRRFIGEEARNKRGVLHLKYPIEHGAITNWDDWETLYYHVFYEELKKRTDEQGVLLVEGTRRARCDREKTTEIMFEKFDVPSLYIAADAALSLLQSGRTTGIVLETGDGATHSVPIYEGCYLRHCVLELPMAGRSITDYLRKLLQEKGHDFNSSAQWDTIRDIKEKLSYVALDFDEELQTTGSDRRSNESSYELPDGQVITLENERFRCTEPLFRPTLQGVEMPGIHEILHSSIRKCDIDLRKELYANIVLSGGNAMFPGIVERVAKEMANLAPYVMKIRVSNHVPTAKYQAWIGGSILASSSNFIQMSINKDEYDEYGPTLVRKKCF